MDLVLMGEPNSWTQYACVAGEGSFRKTFLVCGVAEH